MTDRWRVAANLATLANGLLGVGAILYTLGGNKLWAMLLIGCAIGFDGLDGMLSRRSPKPGSRFGRVADSVADGITFGLAPAFLIAVHTGNVATWAPWEPLAVALAAGYFAAAIARLTYFTVRTHELPHFLGVPTPESALALVVALLFHDTPAFQSVQPIGLFAGVAVLSVMMVVPGPLPEGPPGFAAPSRRSRHGGPRGARARAPPVPPAAGFGALPVLGHRVARYAGRGGELLSSRPVRRSEGAPRLRVNNRATTRTRHTVAFSAGGAAVRGGDQAGGRVPSVRGHPGLLRDGTRARPRDRGGGRPPTVRPGGPGLGPPRARASPRPRSLRLPIPLTGDAGRHGRPRGRGGGRRGAPRAPTGPPVHAYARRAGGTREADRTTPAESAPA